MMGLLARQCANPNPLAPHPIGTPARLHQQRLTNARRTFSPRPARLIPLRQSLCVALLAVCLLCTAVEAEFEMLLSGWYVDKVFTPGLQAPNHVAVSASGIIAITQWGSCDRVFRLHDDGSLSTYAAPSTANHAGIVFDATENLYVADFNGVLWRVTPGGAVSEFASAVDGYQMDISPDGEIFAAGGGGTAIQRITTDGQVSVYADGLTGPCDVAVSPSTGVVFILDFGAGTLYRVDAGSTLTPLISGLVHEWSYIACSPSGELYYWIHAGNLYRVSTLDGTRTELTWVKDSIANLHPTDFVFDHLSRIVCVDITYNHVVRLDLTTQTAERLWLGMGNTQGLAVAPVSGGLYMTFGHPFASGSGGVVGIETDGSTTPVVDGLGPDVCGLAFDSNDTGYVISTSLVADEWRSTVHSFSQGGVKVPMAMLPYHGHSLDVHPSTGQLWGLSYGEIWYFDDVWTRHVIPTASVGELVESLAFTPDGTLYVVIIRSDMMSIPVEAGLYRVNFPGPTFALVADLSTIGMCCPLHRIGGGRDGNIYWVGFCDRYTSDNEPDMHMLRITSGGVVTLFGQQLPMDPAAIAGDPSATDLYVASGCGVYRIFSTSPAVFKVEAWRGNIRADGAVHAAGFHGGGGDVAEWVSVSEGVKPGDVLELDPMATAVYRPSQTPCSSLVAGVVSTEPGFVLGEDTAIGRHVLLALTGVVPVKVTSEGGPIQPGDLLVSSSTPGHAMRWSGADPCPCALVGKALELMTDESGMILVLLTAH